MTQYLLPLLISILCASGLLLKCYNDNLFQQWGLFGIIIGCIGIVGANYYNSLLNEAVDCLMIGLSLFALGTAYKVRRHATADALDRHIEKIHEGLSG